MSSSSTKMDLMKYPPELRFMVYKVVANDEANTRIIEVIPTVLKYPPTSINAWSFEVAILQLPLMILVNREITEELLRSCFIAPFSSQTFRLGTNTLALDLRFNPENDVLFLNANCYVSMQMREFLPLQSLFEAIFGDNISKIAPKSCRKRFYPSMGRQGGSSCGTAPKSQTFLQNQSV